MTLYDVKKGQRWMWKSDKDCTIVEMQEDARFSSDDCLTIRCKIIQYISGFTFGIVGVIQPWYFGDNMSNWIYLQGQHSPL